jgi:hypothetical protein
VARIEDSRNAYRVSVRKTEEVRSIGRSRCRWKYNIKIYLEKIGWNSFDMGTRAGPFDRCNILGSIKFRLSPFYLRNKTFPNRTLFHRDRQLVSSVHIELEDAGYAQVPKRRIKY